VEIRGKSWNLKFGGKEIVRFLLFGAML
jgi:hypothetical protein